MTEINRAEENSNWKKFIRRHRSIFALFAGAVIMAAIGAAYVFWWFAGYAQSTGLVPSTLNIWTMNNLVSYILYLIFWELVLIGIPAAVGAVIGWQWWKRLPTEEREHRLFGRGSRSRNAGGAISPLLFIAFAIKVYVDGNWNIAISTYTLNYVVNSIITILIWMAVIFAIPATIALIWWIHRESNKIP